MRIWKIVHLKRQIRDYWHAYMLIVLFEPLNDNLLGYLFVLDTVYKDRDFFDVRV